MLSYEELRTALEGARETRWEASPQPIFVPAGEGADNRRFGLRVAPADRAMLRPAEFAAVGGPAPPPRVDWREAAGVTPVKHQGNCGACVAFATCAALESSHLITAKEEVDLSEAHLFFCNGGLCEDGWEFIAALEAARTTGVAAEADFPYQDHQIACQSAPARLKLKSYRRLLSRIQRQRALVSGPVIGGMQVFEDFLYYRSGIYQHQVGDFEGNHAILVVGYDNDDGCWICKNSWGEGFGEKGYFRIAYGECELDDANPFFSVELEA